MATQERRVSIEDARRSLEDLLQDVDAGTRIILTRPGKPDILLAHMDQPGVTPKGQPNRGSTPTTLKGQPNRG